MTLHDFSQDVVPILQFAASFLGIVGLGLVWHQIRLTNSWNRVNTQHALLSIMADENLEKRFWIVHDKYTKNSSGVLTEQTAEEIYSNIEDWTCVKTFLNKHEYFCAAVEASTIEDNYAYSVHAPRVILAFLKFEEIGRASCRERVYVLV